MLAVSRMGVASLRQIRLISAAGFRNEQIAEQIRRHCSNGSLRKGCAHRKLTTAASTEDDGFCSRTKSARRISDLRLESPEPPLIAQRQAAPYSEQEIISAVSRLQRKLRRFLLHQRTPMKLDAMWALYIEIKRSSEWRINVEMLDQFLKAILRAGEGTEWCKKASDLVNEELERTKRVPVNTYMHLFRIFAKFGDIQRFDGLLSQIKQAYGSGWANEQPDFYETWAAAYARADMPAQAERILNDFPRTQEDSVKKIDGQSIPPRVFALREVLFSWVRRKNVDQAWAVLSQLLAFGYGRSAREWNALLHMHAVDLRYRYELLEQVLSRMRAAGVAYDKATYNIMMHACLLRGKQVFWKDWFKRMELAGFKADSFAYTALVGQLVNNGQWGEALRVIKHMKANNLQYKSVASASITSMERRRNRIHSVMERFRQTVLKGGTIPVHQFTPVICAALENPRMWATEIALMIRCLEDGRVKESAVVDSLAARLPGLDTANIDDRPLLQQLRSDPESLGKAFEDSLTQMANTGANTELADKCVAFGQLVQGSTRKSLIEPLDVVVQTLLRGGNIQRAEAVIMAAKQAGVEISSPHTLVSILYHTLNAGQQKPLGLSEKITATRFVPPTTVPTAMLIHHVKAGDLGSAKSYYHQVERLVDSYPSIRAFNAMLLYASAIQNTSELKLKWQQMDAKGVVPDVVSHQTRIFCFSKMDDLLRTRRAYTDMLDHGYSPTFPAVSAVVRCCIRSGDIQLARTIVNHAEVECGVALNTTTYNYILARIAGQSDYQKLAARMFTSMTNTPDRRVSEKFNDAAKDVAKAKQRFVDLRMLEREHTRLGSWMMRPTEDRTSSSRLRRALVNWLTSRAAFSAAPTLFDPRRKRSDEGSGTDQKQAQNKKSRAAPSALATRPLEDPNQANTNVARKRVRADAPPPDSTTFIIMIRANGKHRRWGTVLEVWDTMLEFNKRVDKLVAERHLHAASHRIVPFSRMVGWVVLSLHQLGRADDARELWQAAESDGVLSASAKAQGMEAMLEKLLQYCSRFSSSVE